MYSTYVAKQIDGVWCRSVCRPGQMDVRRGLGHRLKSWRTFPRSSSWHHTRFGCVAESDRSENVKHTANLLRCWKLRLSGYAHAGGTVFVVGKPKFGSLRVVWHGTWVSSAAVAPPKPPHLADVTSLTHLQLRGGELLTCFHEGRSVLLRSIEAVSRARHLDGSPTGKEAQANHDWRTVG